MSFDFNRGDIIRLWDEGLNRWIGNPIRVTMTFTTTFRGRDPIAGRYGDYVKHPTQAEWRVYPPKEETPVIQIKKGHRYNATLEDKQVLYEVVEVSETFVIARYVYSDGSLGVESVFRRELFETWPKIPKIVRRQAISRTPSDSLSWQGGTLLGHLCLFDDGSHAWEPVSGEFDA